MAHLFKVGCKARVKVHSEEFPVGIVVTAVEVEPPDYDGIVSARWTDGNETHWMYDHAVELVEAVQDFDLLSAMTGKPLKFRSGCDVKFIAYSPEAKPHCQLVLLNPSTGNIVTRYANGKGSTEPYDEPGDILVKEAA
ncbi:hypothetical protein [Burkholderia pseudomallei]|uniref:hypothetical protein n=1 Tax=Burkholderia pseudomallei TaxID=28450 RepID=UPI00050FBF19|nr:hypothetical protein [Burkholderia pseudomallei]AIV77119.1 hypothetical protein X994_1392 [Burkholderia pseudomallei]KGC37665.1 hypothetical protein DO62_5161 [Burkholderia pseudomallei]MCW0128332.1 hypothetical protein [Burkholderia pseudomallei]CAJ2853506.1 Uncharacterised protein [Burkholderia pseudomallei]CAJ3080740.1 Uncharacterised protein [Burkholderia pseudomallei]